VAAWRVVVVMLMHLLLPALVGVAVPGIVALVVGKRRARRHVPAIEVVPIAMVLRPAAAVMLVPARRRVECPAAEERRAAMVVAHRHAQDVDRHVVGRHERPGTVVPLALVPVVIVEKPVVAIVEKVVLVQVRRVVHGISGDRHEPRIDRDVDAQVHGDLRRRRDRDERPGNGHAHRDHQFAHFWLPPGRETTPTAGKLLAARRAPVTIYVTLSVPDMPSCPSPQKTSHRNVNLPALSGVSDRRIALPGTMSLLTLKSGTLKPMNTSSVVSSKTTGSPLRSAISFGVNTKRRALTLTTRGAACANAPPTPTPATASAARRKLRRSSMLMRPPPAVPAARTSCPRPRPRPRGNRGRGTGARDPTAAARASAARAARAAERSATSPSDARCGRWCGGFPGGCGRRTR